MKEGNPNIKKERIISAFLSEIRTISDRHCYLAFFTNFRIILVNLHISNSLKVDFAIGPIGWGIKERWILKKVKKLAKESKISIENILKNKEDIIEIKYDKIIEIKYKYDEEYQTSYFWIEYPEPLWKSKNKIKLVIQPEIPYRKAIIKQGIKSGNLSIDFGEDILSILQPFVGDKLIMSKK